MNVNDARVRNTKEKIRKTFLELLKGKPAAKITVKELCEKSGINRATFYKHYADVYDLMEKLEEEILLEEKQMLESLNLTSIEDMYRQTLLGLRKYQDTWLSLAGWNGDPHFTIRQMNVISSYAFPLLEKSLSGLSEKERKLVFDYLLQGSSGLVYHWMKEDHLPLEDTVRIISELTRGVCDAACRLA